jgi:hypothetical protein
MDFKNFELTAVALGFKFFFIFPEKKKVKLALKNTCNTCDETNVANNNNNNNNNNNSAAGGRARERNLDVLFFFVFQKRGGEEECR